nr:MAG TPA: hypothetical protein [Caudoviricetes sp.]
MKSFVEEIKSFVRSLTRDILKCYEVSFGKRGCSGRPHKHWVFYVFYKVVMLCFFSLLFPLSLLLFKCLCLYFYIWI